MRRTTWRGPLALVVAVVAWSALVGGCASTGDEDAGDSAGGEADAPAADAGAGTDESTAGGGGAASEGGGLSDASAVDLLAAQRDVVRTGSMRMTVDDATAAGAEVRDIATSVDGFVADEQVRAADDTVTVTVRVPSDRFYDVLAEVGGLGDVTEQDVEARDVTAEVVDLDSRIESLRASVERVRGLLEGAGTVDQLAAVEGQLTSRETELEALLGQQRVLADQVALGTLTVHLGEDEAPAPAEGWPGFTDGLRRGWVVLVDGVRIVLVVAGFLLPFAAPLGLVGAGVLRWQRRRRPAPAPEPSA